MVFPSPFKERRLGQLGYQHTYSRTVRHVPVHSSKGVDYSGHLRFPRRGYDWALEGRALSDEYGRRMYAAVTGVPTCK